MSESAPAAIFSLADLDFAYPEQPPLFTGLHFTLYPGRRVGLYGPTGSGKTTFLRLIAGLEKPLRGGMFFHGQPLRGEKDFRVLRRSVGFVLQNADDQIFCPTVLEDVAFGPLNLGFTRDEARERARRMLRILHLGDLENRPSHRLSGGEKKLVALAGVLAMEPEALLLDEPTNGLDAKAAGRLAEALAFLPAARLIVSHDVDFLEKNTDEILAIAGGCLEQRDRP